MAKKLITKAEATKASKVVSAYAKQQTKAGAQHVGKKTKEGAKKAFDALKNWINK